MAKKEVKEKKMDLKGGEVFNIIRKPRITEKASILAENNFYTFEVDKRSNKIEIKDFIEKKYNVHIDSIRIVNVPKKPKKRGLIKGFKSGFKKAFIKVREGEQIDFTAK
ncbi:MAG: 50S ribosomal protein L23 [Candidatus Pacebacteria bacterium]|nr:50S ribosomal protein L23 [Candidatus Paceibacterota bacterium]